MKDSDKSEKRIYDKSNMEEDRLECTQHGSLINYKNIHTTALWQNRTYIGTQKQCINKQTAKCTLRQESSKYSQLEVVTISQESYTMFGAADWLKP